MSELPSRGHKVVTLADMHGNSEIENPFVVLLEYDAKVDGLVISLRGLYEVERLAQICDEDQIAHILGIKPHEFEAVMERQPQVKEAMRRGKARCIVDIGAKVVGQARGGNLKAAMFYLERKAGWTKHKHGEGEVTSLEQALEELADEEERDTD
jgi:hypothetical protein